MHRVGFISRAVAIAAIVGLVGLSLYLVFGLSRIEAGLTVACVMLGMAQLVNLTVRDRSGVDVEGIRRSVAEVASSCNAVKHDSDVLRSRVAALEDHRDDDAAARSEQLDQQMKMLEGLVDQLAAGLDRAERPSAVAAAISPASGRPAFADAAAAAADAEILATVRRSIETNRVDLYLQPIVTLPQRRTRFYEGLTRLRGAGGQVILPSAYIRVAERAGVMPEIDNMLLTGCVQVVRRMVERNRELGIFCNISAHSLLDVEFFPKFIDFMRANADLSNAVFFEFSQDTVNGFGALEHESLSALKELGFSFSLDRVTRLDLDAEALAHRGFRFIKVECDILLNRSREAGAHIHGADLSELLRRSGIELIVEKIESERAVIDLLDYDIAFGQGYLFSAPRPVRGEVLDPAPLRATG